jgi:hypothetical protein
MSITSNPVLFKPRINAAANAGTDTRPSRPTATAFSPATSAALPKARPRCSANVSSIVLPTTPRMS